MPAYYDLNNIAPANAFATGAAVGFELFDRAIERRRQYEQQQVENQRADKQLAMTTESHNAEMADREQRNRDAEYDRQRAYETNAGQAFDQGAQQYGTDASKWDPAARAQVAANARRVNPNFATLTDDEVITRAGSNSKYLASEAAKLRDEDKRTAAVSDVLGMAGGDAPAADAPTTGAAGGPRRGGPAVARGDRLNNPANLKWDGKSQWQGMTGVDPDGFVVFDTPENGLRAGARNLMTQAGKGPMTLRSLIANYAPASDKNNPEKYASYVASQLGISPDQPIDLRDPATNAAVLQQLVGYEQGRNPGAADQYHAAAAAAKPGSLLGAKAKPSYSDPISRAVETVAAIPGKVLKAADNAQVRGVLRPALDPDNPAGDGVRADPTQYFNAYKDTREGFDVAERTKLDTLMYEGLTRDLNNARTSLGEFKNPKNRADAIKHINELTGKVAALNELRAKDTVAQAVPRPTKGNDAVANAVQQAVAQAQSGPQVSNSSEIRALTTQTNRWADNPPKRFTQEQTQRIARAVALGVITMEQGANLVRYHQMDKPSAPKLTDMGMGLAVGVNDDGQMFTVDLSDKYAAVMSRAEAAKASVKFAEGMLLKPEEMRQRLENNTQSLYNMFKEQKGDFDTSGPSGTLAGFNEVITRYGDELESRFGLKLRNPYTNARDISQLSYGELSILANAYNKYYNLEVDEFLKSGKSFGDYVAEQGVPEVPQAQAAQGASGNDGWKITRVN